VLALRLGPCVHSSPGRLGSLGKGIIVLALQNVPESRTIVGTEALALPAFLLGAEASAAGLANALPELVDNLLFRIPLLVTVQGT
jgi:hypothetical protein